MFDPFSGRLHLQMIAILHDHGKRICSDFNDLDYERVVLNGSVLVAQS